MHCICLQCIAFACSALHSLALHSLTLHSLAVHCIRLHCIRLHCIRLHSTRLHPPPLAPQAIVSQDLVDGQHRNPTDKLDYFTSVFFHTPDDLRSEVKEAGLQLETIVGLEGPVCLMQNFDQLVSKDGGWCLIERREEGGRVLSRLCMSYRLMACLLCPSLLGQWEDHDTRRVIMSYLEKIESDECMLGVSQHLVAIVSKEEEAS